MAVTGADAVTLSVRLLGRGVDELVTPSHSSSSFTTFTWSV